MRSLSKRIIIHSLRYFMIGRSKELTALNSLFQKKTSSLVVLKGKRRIGATL